MEKNDVLWALWQIDILYTLKVPSLMIRLFIGVSPIVSTLYLVPSAHNGINLSCGVLNNICSIFSIDEVGSKRLGLCGLHQSQLLLPQGLQPLPDSHTGGKPKLPPPIHAARILPALISHHEHR